MTVKKFFRCIVMGPPGSGKGTVAERIVRNFDIVHFPSGDYLRREMQNNTQIGREAKEYIVHGKLVPDHVISHIVLKELSHHSRCHWLIDGFPRTVKQAHMLEEHYHIDAVIDLNVPFDVIVERLKDRWIHLTSGRIYNLGFNPPKSPGIDDVTGEALVQREDDKPETVTKRLHGYKTWEKPVSEFYAKKNIVHRFSGKTTNEIWPQVQEFLQSKLPAKTSVHQKQSNQSTLK